MKKEEKQNTYTPKYTEALELAKEYIKIFINNYVMDSPEDKKLLLHSGFYDDVKCLPYEAQQEYNKLVSLIDVADTYASCIDAAATRLYTSYQTLNELMSKCQITIELDIFLADALKSAEIPKAALPPFRTPALAYDNLRNIIKNTKSAEALKKTTAANFDNLYLQYCYIASYFTAFKLLDDLLEIDSFKAYAAIYEPKLEISKDIIFAYNTEYIELRNTLTEAIDKKVHTSEMRRLLIAIASTDSVMRLMHTDYVVQSKIATDKYTCSLINYIQTPTMPIKNIKTPKIWQMYQTLKPLDDILARQE